MSATVRAIRTLAVGVAATGLLLAATASPADAKTRTFTDKRGDAMSALDITKVTVTNKKRVVIVRATVPDLRKSKLGVVGVDLRTKARGRPEYSALKMRLKGTKWTGLMLSDDNGDVPCRGDRVAIGKRTITVRIPQRCLDGNRRAVKVGFVLADRDWLESFEGDPKPGPNAPIDVYPSLTSNKVSPWVRYR